MFFVRKKNIKDLLDRIVENKNSDGIQNALKLVEAIRPRTKDLKNTNNPRFEEVLEWIRHNETYRKGLSIYIKNLLEHRKLRISLTESGIVNGNSFFSEIVKRLSYKVLPYQSDYSTVDYLVTNIFYKSSDAIWISKIAKEKWLELFSLLNLHSPILERKNKGKYEEMLFACEVLIQRLCGEAISEEVLRMVPEYQNLESPFIALKNELDNFILNEAFKGEFVNEESLFLKQIFVLIDQCEEFTEKALKNSNKFGISIRANQALLIIEQQLERLRDILNFLSAKNKQEAQEKLYLLFSKVISYNADRNKLRPFIKETTQQLAFEITQHTGKTGEHYITNSAEEYKRMLYSASGGGFVVAILCIFKVLYSKADVSLFGHAFLYSMNYSLGFIAIYLLHFTLATKQPAMTASTLALALKEGLKEKVKYQTFAELFARLFRSQFIAFVGNVFLAFPVALILIFITDLVFGFEIGEYKSYKLLKELDPVLSPALFHAGIAGVYLFLSGLIAGQANNRSIHNKFPLRIREHPIIKLTLGRNIAHKISLFYEKNIGGIASNFWFGIFLGSTGTLGAILGLNLDIRHITFASGNFALGLYGSGFDVNLFQVFWYTIGIGLIGAMNFIISFSLSMLLAMRSRSLTLTQIPIITRAIFRRFKEYPRDFFFPPKELQT